MTIRNKISNIPGFVLFVLILLIGYLGYHLVLFLIKAFVFLGFNTFLFLDNLVKFDSINPILIWGIIGLFIGSIFGVVIAIKKYKLAKIIILYPISLVIVVFSIFSFINKPSITFGTYESLIDENATVAKEKLNYKITQDINVRISPSPKATKLFSLPSGTPVQVIEFIEGYKKSSWAKISYNNDSGYVNSKYLELMQSGN